MCMSDTNFKTAFKVTLPVLFGYLAIGIAFGLMLAEKKYSIWLAAVMSTFMYAGAGQYIAIGLFAQGAPLSAIIVTELFVNIRHIVYGLSLITKFKDTGRWKPYLIFALTDETYSLMTSTEVPNGIPAGKFYGTIALLDQIYWILGGIIGAILGTILTSKTNISLGGIDFALTALFAVLLIDQLEKTKDFLPVITGTVTTLVFIILWRFGIIQNSNDILLGALASGIAIIMLFRHPSKNNGEKSLPANKNSGEEQK